MTPVVPSQMTNRLSVCVTTPHAVPFLLSLFALFHCVPVLVYCCVPNPRLVFYRVGPCASPILAKIEMSADFYAILDLLPSATQDAIKRRYYDLAKVHHPDKVRGARF